MPNIAEFHPQVVHFVIALLFVGVALRIISLTPWMRFSNPAATTLLILGTVASLAAVKSGDDAHGPVERIPGVRPIVVEHEELGERSRNIFLGVVAIELLALGLFATTKTRRFGKLALAGSAVLGVIGSVVLYEAAEHGGELVYSYAGGPGLRTGDPEDVKRLLLAGLYAQSQADRRAKRPEDAARLINEMAARFPDDRTIRYLHAESMLLDASDPAAARTALAAAPPAPTDARVRARHDMLLADVHLALGQADSARAVLAGLVDAFPTNTRAKAKLDSIPSR